MFQQFTNYLLGSYLGGQQSSSPSQPATNGGGGGGGGRDEGVESNRNARLTSVVMAAEESGGEEEDHVLVDLLDRDPDAEEYEEGDWVLVDRQQQQRHHLESPPLRIPVGTASSDSEGNSGHSSEDDDEGDICLKYQNLQDDDLIMISPTARRRRNRPRRQPMEESWFLTPPPCFISSGPVHMATSPLENLLIEHPSMSVYATNHHHHHHHSHALFEIGGGPFTPRTASPSSESMSELFVLGEEDFTDDLDLEIVLPDDDVHVHEEEVVVMVGHRGHGRMRGGAANDLQQQEMQVVRNKQAQKVQTKKARKAIRRGAMDRTNKAREVNGRNQRRRRGERSQGATRSHANNNRKCC